MRYNRVFNLLLPVLGMYKFSRGFLFFNSRKEADKYLKKNINYYPYDYNVNKPTYTLFRNWKNYELNYRKKVYNLFSAKEHQREQVSLFLESNGIDLKKDKLISISLRESPWGNLTNSKIKEWIKFADYLLSFLIAKVIIATLFLKIKII